MMTVMDQPRDQRILVQVIIHLFYNPGSWKPWEFSCNWLPHNFPSLMITANKEREKAVIHWLKEEKMKSSEEN